MKKFRSMLLTIPAMSLLVLGSSSAISYALADAGGAEPNDPTVSDNIKPAVVHGADQEQTTEAENTAKTEAQDMLKTLRQAHKEHTAEQRQKNCQAAKNGLEHKLTNLGKNAAAYQTRIDNVLTKAEAYQKDNNVTVTNWDQLLAAAQTAQTKSAASLAALKALDVNLDCTSSAVATNVATFKAAATQARADLKAYKSAVKEVLTALKDATGSTSSSSSSSGGTQ